MRYVLVEIFGLFWLTPKTPECPKIDPKNDPKHDKNGKYFLFLTFLCIFFQTFRRFGSLEYRNLQQRKNAMSKTLF